MVDRERRKKLALHLRHLTVGQITNDDFEERITDDVSFGWLPEQYYRAKQAKQDDPIILPMLELCWGLYDDTTQHKLKDRHKPSDQAMKIISRCILFLQSDQEYRWPYFDINNPLLRFTIRELVTTVLTLGKYYRDKKEEHNLAYLEFQKLGNFDLWPFFNKVDYEEQLTKQPFLNGKKSMTTNV